SGLGLLGGLPLRRLTLDGASGVGNAAAAILANLRQLRTLEIHETAMDNAGVMAIWNATPRCTVNGMNYSEWQEAVGSGRWSATDDVVTPTMR
ncbi:MAG TPA: hypothetical protein VNC50_12050, partial [Planctomycetia bacterium]|nr:hypothetical protein [Planctomycetia bacterium]